MDNALYGPKFRFFQQGGQFLILHPNEDFILNSDNVQSSILKTIQNNKIPHILSVDVNESDINISLQYNIEAKKPLIEALKKNKISMKKFYQLLLKIVTVLSNSQNNGLSVGNYILDEKFIYIGRSLTDIYLAYLPLDGKSHQESFKYDLQYLTTSLIKYVKDLKGKDYQKIMNQFEKSDFKIYEFQVLLEELGSTFPNTHYEGNDGSSQNSNRKSGFSRQIRSKGTHVLAILLVIIVITAVIWKVNPMMSTVKVLYIGAGLGVLGLIVIGIKHLITNRVHKVNKENKTEIDESKLSKETTNLSQLNQDIGNSATVLLGGEVLKESKIFIEFSNGKKVAINKDKYIIGRNSETVSYIVDAIGVSREHLQVMKLNDGGYGVMDLGSRNGTALNGRKMDPNRIYIVKNQDIVSFAEEEVKVLMG